MSTGAATWLALIGPLVATCLAVSSPPVSPCPGVLTYDERDPITARSRWSANIEIRPEQPLRGFTLNVSLDKPADILGNLVGEVTTPDNKHFSINTRKKLPAGLPFTIRIFVKHSSDVPVITTIHLNGLRICPSEPSYFQADPRRALARPGDSVVLLARARAPLRHCLYLLPPDDHVIDLSRGRESVATNEYEYHGRGLENGECGLRLKRVQEENDGVVECRVRPLETGAAWLSSATTLRVTHLPVQRLPVFDVVPRRKTLNVGENVTVICNADRPLNLCHFYLPGHRVLNLDLGPASEYTREYRYHGSGLQHGHCGVTLTGVDRRLAGFLVCKLGRWPEQVTGAWETDAMRIEVAGAEDSAQAGPGAPWAGPDGAEVAALEPVYNGWATEPTTTTTTTTTTEAGFAFGYSPRNPQESESRGRTPLTSSTDDPPRSPKGNRFDCGNTVVPPPVALVNHGQQTYRGQWPWHVALYQSSENGSLVYICGGSLIGVRSVVTAAHCVTKKPFDRAVDPATLLVYLGRHHLRQWTENGLQEKRVERVVIHPTYNRTGFNSDLAVLLLKSDANFTAYVRPVCLWNAARTDLNEVEGRDGTVVGWGIDERGQLTPELTKATMPVVSFVTCVMSKPQHFLEFLRNTTYCAGFRNGTTVCNGDSGGGMVFPIMTSRGRRWFLRGLVSNSVPRTHEDLAMLVCDPQHYVVFTDVAQYLPWLTPYAV